MQWFKHDSDANQDAKLKRLRMKYGLEGYGLYWYCIELIASNIDQNNLTFELEHDSEIISFDTGIHIERVNEMMAYMVNLGLFESNNNAITCLKMLKRLDQSMTSNKKMREMISQAKENHDSTMMRPDFVMQEENRIEENRIHSKKSKSSIDDYQPVIDIYHKVIEQNSPNWATVQSMTDKRKRLAKKSLDAINERSEKVGLSQYEYLFNLLSVMSQDPFYSGTQSSRDKPNGYRWTIDQILRVDILTQAIDRLSEGS